MPAGVVSDKFVESNQVLSELLSLQVENSVGKALPCKTTGCFGCSITRGPVIQDLPHMDSSNLPLNKSHTLCTNTGIRNDDGSGHQQ